jgi:hypothetical protein
VSAYAAPARTPLAKLLLLIAMLFLPLGMNPAPAAAAAHHGPMANMPMQHCPEQSPKQTKAGFVECTMACSAALPAADLRPGNPPMITCTPVRPCLAGTLHGIQPETATPPPRHS